MRIKSASALLFLLLGYSAFLIPKQVLSENVNAKSGRRITLENRTPTKKYDSYGNIRKTGKHDNYLKASLSFRGGLPISGRVGAGKDDRDLLYGALDYNGDRDWFTVAFGGRDRSRIVDLGEIDWSDDIVVPVLPILPCPKDEPCHRITIPSTSSGKTIQDVNPHLAKPIVGHMYLVRTYDREIDPSRPQRYPDALTDFYTLFRVEELRPNESCTINWKRIPSPKR